MAAHPNMYAWAQGQEHEAIQDAIYEKMRRQQTSPSKLEPSRHPPIAGYQGHTTRRDYDWRERDKDKPQTPPQLRPEVAEVRPAPPPQQPSPTIADELRHMPPGWYYLHTNPTALRKPMPGLGAHYRGRECKEWLAKREKPTGELKSLLSSIGGMVCGATGGFAGASELSRKTAKLSHTQRTLAEVEDQSRAGSAAETGLGRRLSEDGQYHLATVKVPLGYERRGGDIEKVPVKKPGGAGRPMRVGQRASRAVKTPPRARVVDPYQKSYRFEHRYSKGGMASKQVLVAPRVVQHKQRG